jgi:hypothetical protein
MYMVNYHVDDAEEQCRRAWKLVFESKIDEVYNYFFGKMIKAGKKRVEETIEQTVEEILNIAYQYNIEQNAKAFADDLKVFFYVEKYLLRPRK